MNARRLPTTSVALGIVTLVALALLGWQVVVWVDDHRADDRRHAAVAVAEEQVLDLTTLDSSSVKSKLEAMGSRVTGDFKRQFEGFSQTFGDVVRKQKVSATGEIKSAAVSSFDEDSAVVLVASSAQISNAKQQKPTRRDYRMSITLDRVDGDWLISGMEFVP